MSATGIVFANIHDNLLGEMTEHRTIASIPFACRYRFIDFTLSNLVNSDIFNINVITDNNYLSLMDHLGSGKDWDLARRTGGLKILPPNIAAGAHTLSAMPTRLESLKNVYPALKKITDDYVVLADCDTLCNVDIKPIIEEHSHSGADVTLAVKNMEISREHAAKSVLIQSDDQGNITDILTYPENYEGPADTCLNILVMKTEYLYSIMDEAILRGYHSLTRDILAKRVGKANLRVYRFDGFFATISSIQDYYYYNMRVLERKEIYDALFSVKTRPIFTKVRNASPSFFSEGSKITNSMIADGCIIEGTVENSILFRGVRIAKGAVVSNSILMQDTNVDEGVSLNCVITDKNVTIRHAKLLSGCQEQPFYIDKEKTL